MSDIEKLTKDQSTELINKIIDLLKRNPLYITTLIESVFDEGNPDANKFKSQIVDVIKSKVTPSLVKDILINHIGVNEKMLDISKVRMTPDTKKEKVYKPQVTIKNDGDGYRHFKIPLSDPSLITHLSDLCNS